MKKAFVFLAAILLIIAIIAYVDDHHIGVACADAVLIVALLICGEGGKKEMGYKFYGWENANVSAITDTYHDIKTPLDLYDVLSDIWCKETCAPRLQAEWTPENKTLGQCSITAFLVQDIFGGEVYGILRPGGNYHCYNVVGDHVFDLTSEQFGDEVLVYENNPEQSREVHFAKEEKRLRYEYLKKKLEERRA